MRLALIALAVSTATECDAPLPHRQGLAHTTEAPFEQLWRADAAADHCALLARRGVRRVAFVGDSQARCLGMAMIEHCRGDDGWGRKAAQP